MAENASQSTYDLSDSGRAAWRPPESPAFSLRLPNSHLGLQIFPHPDKFFWLEPCLNPLQHNLPKTALKSVVLESSAKHQAWAAELEIKEPLTSN